MTVVIDASALLELWLSADASSIAERLRSETLHAPTHIEVEAANVIRRHRNDGLLTDSAAELARAGILASPLRLWPFQPLAERVWELGPNASSYDAAYIALAERMGVPLVTHDGKLERVPGVRCPVEVS